MSPRAFVVSLAAMSGTDAVDGSRHRHSNAPNCGFTDPV
jgi:hypothetical protein